MARSFADLTAKVSANWDADTRSVYAAASEFFATQARAQLALGAQIVELRTREGLNQTQLAEAAGVPQPEISRIERGVGNPTRETLGRLATALHAHLALVPDEPAITR